MLTEKFRRLFQKLSFEKDSKIKTLKKKHTKKNKKEVQLPDNVLDKIFDYSSPFDVARWRSVNRQFDRVADHRDRAVLYLDVLRMDIHDILPPGQTSDGDFFLHPSCQVVAHSEKRSVLLAAHSHWNSKDAAIILAAVRYYGRYAKTITLDASIAELCVAGQCSTDISHWFFYQAAAGTNDPPREPMAVQIKSPGWLPQRVSSSTPMAVEAAPQWNPRTQRIPIGPIFPQAREISFRASIPQLRRLRRLAVYRTLPSCLFSHSNLQMFRLSVTGGKRCPPTSLKLRPFLEWLDTEALAGKYCTQFC